MSLLPKNKTQKQDGALTPETSNERPTHKSIEQLLSHIHIVHIVIAPEWTDWIFIDYPCFHGVNVTSLHISGHSKICDFANIAICNQNIAGS